MRVGLVHESSRANYSEDILACGLLSVLGQLAVWPVKEHFGGVRSKRAPEGSVWMPWKPAALYPSGACDLDLLIVGNHNSSEHLAAVEEAVASAASKNVPVVALDGDDIPHLDRLEALLPQGPWYVRECSPEMALDDRVRPFPFAVNTTTAPRPRPWKDRDIDVLWGGSVSYASRMKFVGALGQLPESIKTTVIAGRDHDLATWNDLLTRTKICVCLAGAGRMTYRYFEGAAAGCFPLSHVHGLVIPDDFPTLAIGSFTTPEDLIRQIQALLANDDHLCHVAAEATEHAWLWHTAPVRATEFLLSALKI